MANRSVTEFIQSGAETYELPAGDSIKINSVGTGGTLAGIAMGNETATQSLKKIVIKNGGIQVAGSGYGTVFGIDLGSAGGSFPESSVAISFGNGKAAISAAATATMAATSAVAIRTPVGIVLESPAALQGKIAATATGPTYNSSGKASSGTDIILLNHGVLARGIAASGITFGAAPALTVEAVAKGAKHTLNRTLSNDATPTGSTGLLSCFYHMNAQTQAYGLDASVITATEESRQLGGAVTAAAAGGTLAAKVKMIGGSDENKAAANLLGGVAAGAIRAGEITFGGIAADFKLKSVATAAKATCNLDGSGSKADISAFLIADAYGIDAENLNLAGGLGGVYQVSADAGSLAVSVKGDWDSVAFKTLAEASAVGFSIKGGEEEEGVFSAGEFSKKFKLDVVAKGAAVKFEFAGSNGDPSGIPTLSGGVAAKGISADIISGGKPAGAVNATATGGSAAGFFGSALLDAEAKGIIGDLITGGFDSGFKLNAKATGGQYTGRARQELSISAGADAAGIYRYGSGSISVNGILDGAITANAAAGKTNARLLASGGVTDGFFEYEMQARAGAAGLDASASTVTFGGVASSFKLVATATGGRHALTLEGSGGEAQLDAYFNAAATGIEARILTFSQGLGGTIQAAAAGGSLAVSGKGSWGGEFVGGYISGGAAANGIRTYSGTMIGGIEQGFKLTATAKAGAIDAKGQYGESGVYFNTDLKADARGLYSGNGGLTMGVDGGIITGSWTVTATGGKGVGVADAYVYSYANATARGIESLSMTLGDTDGKFKLAVTAKAGVGSNVEATAWGIKATNTISMGALAGAISVSAVGGKNNSTDGASANASAYGIEAGTTISMGELAGAISVSAVGGKNNSTDGSSADATARGIKAGDTLTIGSLAGSITVSAVGGDNNNTSTFTANARAMGIEAGKALTIDRLAGSITVSAVGGKSTGAAACLAHAYGIYGSAAIKLDDFDAKFKLTVSGKGGTNTGSQHAYAYAYGMYGENFKLGALAGTIAVSATGGKSATGNAGSEACGLRGTKDGNTIDTIDGKFKLTVSAKGGTGYSHAHAKAYGVSTLGLTIAKLAGSWSVTATTGKLTGGEKRDDNTLAYGILSDLTQISATDAGFKLTVKAVSTTNGKTEAYGFSFMTKASDASHKLQGLGGTVAVSAEGKANVTAIGIDTTRESGGTGTLLFSAQDNLKFTVTATGKGDGVAEAYGIRAAAFHADSRLVGSWSVTAKGGKTAQCMAYGIYANTISTTEAAWTGGEIAVAAQNGKAVGIQSKNISGDIGGAVVAIGSKGAIGIMGGGDNSNYFTVAGAVYAGSSGNAAGLAASLAKQVGTNKSIASYAAKVRKEGGVAIKLGGSGTVRLAAGSLVIGHLNFAGATSLTISSSAQLCGDITMNTTGEKELNFSIDGPATRNAVITVVNDAGALKGDSGVALSILIKAEAQAGKYILAQGNLEGVEVENFFFGDKTYEPDMMVNGFTPTLEKRGDQLILVLEGSYVPDEASPLFGSGPELGIDQYPAFGAAAAGAAPLFDAGTNDLLKQSLLA